MSMPRKTCAECGNPIKQTKGRGRPRVYCGSACRNVAYERRRSTRPSTTGSSQPKEADDGEVTIVDLLQLPQLRAARERMLMQIDAILDSPTATHDLVQELIYRVALGLVLEDMRYQAAVDQLVVAYRMIGRITDGKFRLPAVIV